MCVVVPAGDDAGSIGLAKRLAERHVAESVRKAHVTQELRDRARVTEVRRRVEDDELGASVMHLPSQFFDDRAVDGDNLLWRLPRLLGGDAFQGAQIRQRYQSVSSWP